MFKKQALVFAISALAFTNVAQALGLGDIELNSNLNEPLDADIELTQLRGLTAGEIIPTLASNDAFGRAGIERSFFLSNIQFSLEENEAGDLIIALETRQPVREPFLNFLVEVNWPGGRLLKEYTLLLDPPVFDTGVAGESLVVDPAARQEAGPATGGDISTTTTVSESSAETEPVPAPSEPREDDLAGDEYRVQRNDTLWEIAMRVPGRDGYNMQQVMLALQDVNPDAFLNDNINRLKAGSVLKFPTAEQMGSRSVQEALREVESQNQGRAASARPTAAETEATEVQLSATESTSSALPEQDGERDPDGYLEVSADGSDGSSAGGESADRDELERLENELAIAGELNDQFERERDELEGRVAELEEQLAIMERMINLQSGDAAALQAELAEQADASAGQADATEQGGAEAATTDAADDPRSAPAEEEASTEPATGQAEAEPQPQPEPEAQPEPVAPAAPEPGIMGFIQQFTQPAVNWVMASVANMIAAAAGLMILILLPFYLRSRRSKPEEESLVDLDDADPADVDSAFDEPFDEDIIDRFDDEDDFIDPGAEERDATSDAVMEAEMYMAYQKYDQAEEKLKTAFAEQPNRSDIGLKLLEVYAETGNSAAFAELENKLTLSAEQQAQADDYRSRMPMLGDNDAMSSQLDDDDLDFGNFSADSDDLASLDDQGNSAGSYQAYESTETDEQPSSPEPESSGLTLDPPASESGSDLDFSLDLDDLELPEEDGDDKGLDFDLEELGLEDDEPATGRPETPASELDFDFDESDDGELSSDLDFSLDETSSGPEPELPKLQGDDDDLDFDMGSAEPDEEDLPELAGSDELPTDDSLGLEDDGAEPAPVDLPEQADGADPLQDLADALPGEAELDDDEFDFLSGNDEASTKLDLARAYIEMDDKDGARDILEEVAQEGSEEQKRLARELMDQL